MSHPHHAVLGTVLTLVIGCASEPPAARVGVDTLPSGTVVVHNTARGSWDSASAWRVTEDLRIGPAEDGPAAFSVVNALAVDADGRIYIADRQAADVRVFGPDGHYVRTIGQKGRGPGEFTWPDGIVLGSDGHLFVSDRSAHRISVFDTSGAFLRDYRRDGPGVMPSVVSGGAAGVTWDAWSVFGATAGERHTVLLRWTDRGYGDTLQFPSFQQAQFEIIERKGRSTNVFHFPVPFTPQELLAATPSGAVWRALSGAYRLTRFSSDADSTLVVTREYQPVPVTADDREGVLPRYRKLFAGSGTDLDESLVPVYHPAMRGMLVDDRGDLWVAIVAADTSRLPFDVFDSRGRYLGAVLTAMTPSMLSTRPVVRGNHFFYVGKDELDVPYVVRLRILGQ